MNSKHMELLRWHKLQLEACRDFRTQALSKPRDATSSLGSARQHRGHHLLWFWPPYARLTKGETPPCVSKEKGVPKQLVNVSWMKHLPVYSDGNNSALFSWNVLIQLLLQWGWVRSGFHRSTVKVLTCLVDKKKVLVFVCTSLIIPINIAMKSCRSQEMNYGRSLASKALPPHCLSYFCYILPRKQMKPVVRVGMNQQGLGWAAFCFIAHYCTGGTLLASEFA